MPAPRSPRWLRTPLLVLAWMAGALPACLAADAPQRWQLVFFHPFRPGVLQQCEDAHLRENYARVAQPDAADPLKAWVVEGPLVLHWRGGVLAQAGSTTTTTTTTAPPAHPPTDLCFTLHVDGRPLVSGAVVHPYSARLLRFPTLVRLADFPQATTTAAQYRLQPRFPTITEEPALPAWSVLGTL